MSNPPESANQPIRFKRDPETGLVIGFPYVYGPDGRIDWRACVDRKFLYVAREHEAKVVAEQGKPIAEVDVLRVRDDWLRIRVGGLNQLAHLRGVRSCTYPHMITRDGYASACCEMEFIPNVESDMMPEVWSGMASATIKSVDKSFIPYLETFAENRAFSRCVKRALQINILSDIEVGGESRRAAEGGDAEKEAAQEVEASVNGFEPCDELAKRCRSHNPPIPFEALKQAAIKSNAETPPEKANERTQADPTTWKGFKDIQPIDAWLLIRKLDEAEAKAKAATEAKGKTKVKG